MKFLVDNNISFRVAKFLTQFFSDSAHVADFNMDVSTEDETIWTFAKKNGYTILTKDNDFEAMSRLFGCPPKVIQLVCGNKPSSTIISILEKSSEMIRLFDTDDENCLMYLQ